MGERKAIEDVTRTLCYLCEKEIGTQSAPRYWCAICGREVCASCMQPCGPSHDELLDVCHPCIRIGAPFIEQIVAVHNTYDACRHAALVAWSALAEKEHVKR